MKRGQILVLMLLLTQVGCNWLPYAVKNIYGTPAEQIAELHFRHRLQTIARKLWKEIQNKEPGTYSKDYAKGFEDGFVEFVDRDGSGEPPAAPPPCYERGILRSPEGQTAIVDWYAGYRHGAAAARESGLRERVVIPIALPPRSSTETALSETAPAQPVEEPVPLNLMPTPVPPKKQ